MKRKILSFSKDADDHWQALLECGHYQHTRHNPPWEYRQWTLTDQGRKTKVGRFLNCTVCDGAEFLDPENSDSLERRR